MNNVLISSFFGNSYVTLLDIEIKDYIYAHGSSSKQEFIDILQQRGYSISDITDEIDRQCCCAALKYNPSDHTYCRTDIGVELWHDICYRIHDQKSMIAGEVHVKKPFITLIIYRTDFQTPQLRKKVSSLGLRRAPVMKWAGHYKDRLPRLDTLMTVLPVTGYHDAGDRSCVVTMIDKVITRKSKRKPWAWLVTHPVVELEVTPLREEVLHALLGLCNGPVDWKGTAVSFYELKRFTGFSLTEIKEALEYLQKQGIVRQVDDDFTLTIQGYTLLRHAFTSYRSLTFAVVHRTDKKYCLEISAPSYLDSEIRHLLKELGGAVFSDVCTPVVFPLCEKSRVIDVIDMVIKNMQKEAIHTENEK